MRHFNSRVVRDYIEVLKPRESLLLSFIGICAAIMAGGGFTSPGRLLLVTIGLLAGSSGTNGLTNYLDRHIDAKMQRTTIRQLKLLKCGTFSLAESYGVRSGHAFLSFRSIEDRMYLS